MRADTITRFHWLAAVLVATGGCGDDESAIDGRPNIDDAAVFDGSLANDGAVDATPPAPTLGLTVTRFDSSTELPPVAAIAMVRDAAGEPWSGAVSITAANPAAGFLPNVSAVTALGGGRYRAVVSADQTGEVAIVASATVDDHPVSATETVVFLRFVAADWDIPRSVISVNSPGPEDSIAVSPDGRTLFFSYQPLEGCNFMPAGLGDPPDKPECREPYYPIATPRRPCDNGIGDDGKVTLGLFDDQEEWPWPKGMYNTYVATRRADGGFEDPVCISFADDGAILEVSPSSGPVNPVAGEPYPLFFGYPDWLDIDPAHHGSVFAVATVTAGESVVLSDPITAIGSPPANNLATTLTGDFNTVRETAATVGEFRVHYNPLAANYQLYFERRETSETTMDIVVSPLEAGGSYPVGDWGAAVPVVGAVNTDDSDEGFPWLVELPGDGLHLFFNRGPTVAWTAPIAIYDSRWEAGGFATPTLVLEAPPTGDPDGVLVVALPSVSVGDFGIELFFVYVVRHSDDKLDFQIGVVSPLG